MQGFFGTSSLYIPDYPEELKQLTRRFMYMGLHVFYIEYNTLTIMACRRDVCDNGTRGEILLDNNNSTLLCLILYCHLDPSLYDTVFPTITSNNYLLTCSIPVEANITQSCEGEGECGVEEVETNLGGLRSKYYTQCTVTVDKGISP